MTINQCQEAINLNHEIKRYRGALHTIVGCNFIHTECIDTGYGTDKVRLSIPREIAVQVITEAIEHMQNALRKLNVEEDCG